jgi:hypothetical protein
LPDGRVKVVAVRDLDGLPQSLLANCFIVSTGHGTSGPFTFRGVGLLDFIGAQLGESGSWSNVEVLSADGFGTSIQADELHHPHEGGLILLATGLNGRMMTRAEGLVRLIVPGEVDDALRQVKWIGQINIR